MRILIFGSGSSVIFYIKDNKDFFENNIEILAFLDNNSHIWGNKLFGKEITSPQNIFKYEYDALLICSVYENEIYEQLVFQMGISRLKIYTRRSFFEKYIFKWYDKKYDLYNKKVIIISEDYGTDEQYKKYYGRYYDLLNISKIISLNRINEIENSIYDYVLFTNFNPLPIENQPDFKKNYKLVESMLINKLRLLTIEVINVYFNNIKQIKLKEHCDEKKFLIIRINRFFMGLGTIAQIVSEGVTYAKEIGYIPIVDMKTLKTQYLEDGEYGKINAYDKFFEQPDVYNIDDVKDAGCVAVMYSVKWFSKKKESKIFLPKMKNELYNRYYEFNKRFNNKNVLGVLFRGTDYANLKPYRHNIQPDLNTMIQTVKEKIIEWGEFDLIYLCTEVKEACDKFEDEFGKEKVCYYPQLRYKSNTKSYLAEIILDSGERTKQAKDYWVALNCLASCNSVVAGKSAGTTIALIINNKKFEHTYLFELGKYGLDDI